MRTPEGVLCARMCHVRAYARTHTPSLLGPRSEGPTSTCAEKTACSKRLKHTKSILGSLAKCVSNAAWASANDRGKQARVVTACCICVYNWLVW